MEASQELLPFVGIAILSGIVFSVVISQVFLRFFLKSTTQEKLNERLYFQRERAFFNKYGDLKEKFRTLTFNEVILQAINLCYPGLDPNPDSNPDIVDGKIKLCTAVIPIPEDEEDNFSVNRALTENEEYATEPTNCLIDLEKLRENQDEYEAFLRDLFQTDDLASVCPCDDNVNNYCEWSKRMIQVFIVNQLLWEVSNVQILDDSGNIISNSGPISNKVNPDSPYAVIEMSDVDNINDLADGSIIYIQLTWIVNGKAKNILIRNKIPSSPQEFQAPTTSSKNGATLRMEALKKSKNEVLVQKNRKPKIKK